MPYSAEEANRRDKFDQLHYVYYQAAPNFLRGVFYELWGAVESVKWEDDKSNGQKLMSVKGIVGVIKGGKLQKKNVESGNSFLWDLSLLVDILSVLLRENSQVVLKSFDLCLFTKKNLEWLKSTRNKLAHAGTTEMDTATFQPLWDDTKKILIGMGMSGELLRKPTQVPENIKTFSEPTVIAKMAEAFQASGNLRFKESQFWEAAMEYSKGIDLDDVPQELLGTLYANRSVTFLQIGDFEAAKDDAKSAITLRPNWFRGYARLGNAYEKLEKFSKALFPFNVTVHLGDSSEKTKESIEFCKMMIHKLRRSEATDPEIMRQKDLRYSQSKTLISTFLGQHQFQKFYEGTPLQLCQMAHRYYFGREEYPQDYELAADFFAKAASLGDPEGLYNLGRMTQEGKGVGRDVFKGHQLILQAAQKPPTVEYVPGSGMKTRHIGVIEAWHKMGMAYDMETAVSASQEEAMKWYMKAVEFGSGMSANNIAIIYDNGNREDFPKAVDFWKLSSHLKTVRGAENLANAYLRQSQFQLAQKWYHYSVCSGSIDIQLSREVYVQDLLLESSFDAEAFRLEIKSDLETSGYTSLVLKKIGDNLKDLWDSKGWFESMQAEIPETGGRAEAIKCHRRSQQKPRLSLNSKILPTTYPATLLPTSSGVDLLGLQEIFFKEMKEEKEDKVFTGRALKVEVIEDAILGNPSIGLLVEDSNGDVGRLFVYNYPQRKKTQEELGYGCRLTIIYPHYRTMTDRRRGLRVDDPQLIFRHEHLRNPKRCRYCGKAEGRVIACRKCRRITYCSKLCLQEDEKVLQHSLVCFKTIDSMIKQ